MRRHSLLILVLKTHVPPNELSNPCWIPRYPTFNFRRLARRELPPSAI
jgi:hypothetical protein